MTGRGELFQMDSLERSLISATFFLTVKFMILNAGSTKMSHLK